VEKEARHPVIFLRFCLFIFLRFSLFGYMFGSVGGLLAGGFGAASAGLLGTGAIAGLLSNPITAVASGALLIGSLFMGKAKQRKADEKQADEYWVALRDKIVEMTAQVKSNSLDGDVAWSQYQQYKQEAIDAISGIKTKSVRESRLKNQIPLVDKYYTIHLENAINEQKVRRGLAGKLIPEFATGGIVPGPLGAPRLVLAHGGELIASLGQQTPSLMRAAQESGVPGVRGDGGYASGGGPINVTVVMGTEQQSELIVNGVKMKKGYDAFVRQVNRALKDGDIKARDF
jgi:hypothetical protein